jgi:hypothetical protein
MAVKLTRRFHDGLSVLGGYTLSKSTDNGSGIRTLNGDTLFPQDSFCLQCEWARSIFDVRHRFVASVLYELPFGRGKPYLVDGLGGAILGFPRNVTVGTDRSNTGGGQDRPNATGEPVELPRDQRTVQRWFNTNAYVAQPAGTWGDVGRNTVTGPGITNVDVSIIRNFRLADTKTLQFRLEAFNAINHPIWNDPNTTLTSPNYGTITSTRKPMRELQIGLKFIF